MFWNLRICRTCGLALPETSDYYGKTTQNSSGLLCRCRKCKHAVYREKYLKNREALKPIFAAYRKSHAEQVKASIRRWHAANKERVSGYRKTAESRATRLARQKQRYATDAQYREKVKLLRRLDHALRGTSAKSSVTATLLGCSQLALRAHIEKQFQDGMTWNNRGKGKAGWQIDHIVPCCRFDLLDEDQRKACFNYTNLRPVWSVDNLRKGMK